MIYYQAASTQTVEKQQHWPHLDNRLLIGYPAQVEPRIGALLHLNSNANISVTSSQFEVTHYTALWEQRSSTRANSFFFIMVGIITLQGLIEPILLGYL